MTPRPGRPQFSNFGPPAERRPFCKKVFGHGEKAWFSRFGRPRGAVGHFSVLGAHLHTRARVYRQTGARSVHSMPLRPSTKSCLCLTAQKQTLFVHIGHTSPLQRLFVFNKHSSMKKNPIRFSKPKNTIVTCTALLGAKLRDRATTPRPTLMIKPRPQSMPSSQERSTCTACVARRDPFLL